MRRSGDSADGRGSWGQSGGQSVECCVGGVFCVNFCGPLGASAVVGAGPLPKPSGPGKMGAGGVLGTWRVLARCARLEPGKWCPVFSSRWSCGLLCSGCVALSIFFATGKKRLKFAAWCFRKQCGLYNFVSSAPLGLQLGQHLYRATGYMCGEWRRLNRSAR